MDIIVSIFNFIREHCFNSPRSTIITICLFFAFIFFYKLAKDKGDNMKKTVQYLIGTGVFFGAFLIVY